MQKNGVLKLVFIMFGFVLIAVFLFATFYPKSAAREEPEVNHITTKIQVTHQFKSGLHTYVGTVDAPTPCHSILGEAIVKESYPEQVDIRIETKESGGICAQVITTKKFKVSFSASENPVVRAFVNGTPVLLEVTEAPATINLEKVGM